MARKRDYKTDLLEDLRNDLEYAGEYLSAAYADSQEAFLVALRDVAEAQKGMAKVASQTKLNRETLYRTLSKHGNPRLNTARSVLDVLNLKVLIVSQHANVPPLTGTEPLVTIGQSAIPIQRNTKISATMGAWHSTFCGLATASTEASMPIDYSTQPNEIDADAITDTSIQWGMIAEAEKTEQQTAQVF